MKQPTHADIYLGYSEDPQQLAYDLMASANVKEKIEAKMQAKPKGFTACIKPNLVVSRPADGGATTHPEIIAGIIEYLQDAGVKDIIIAEGSWVGDSTQRAFNNCGYTDLSRKYGVKLVDLKSDSAVKVSAHGVSFQVCETAQNADYLINVPVMKGHCQTDMTCCLKNLKGCIPDSEKRRFHTIGLHKPIAALASALKPDLHIVDSICGDLSFEEGGNPVTSNRILLGFDGLLIDSYCAGLMGYSPDEIDHLRYAKQFGLGDYANAGTEIFELNPERCPKLAAQPSRQAKRLGESVDEDGACSACYAALIFALHKNGGYRLRDKIKIGQGWRDKSPEGVGVGNCANGCTKYIPGCPPRAVDIAKFLRNL